MAGAHTTVVNARLDDTLAPWLTVGRDESTKGSVAETTVYGGGGKGTVLGAVEVDVGAESAVGGVACGATLGAAGGAGPVRGRHPGAATSRHRAAAQTGSGRGGVEGR
jgi:hypothetical protein